MRLIRYNQLATVIATLLLSTPLWATNGYFTHGIGTKNKSMAGAGIALPEDPISIANNPASALATAGKMNAGLALFSPSRRYKTSDSLVNGNFGAFTIGPNDIKSSSNYFVIPNFAGSWKLNDESALAVAFYGRGGMNTDYRGGTATFDPDGPGPAGPTTFPGTFGAKTAGVDLNQAFLDIAYARKAGEIMTWGASLVVVGQVFAARGVGSFAPFTESFAASGGTAFPTKLSNNGHEFSYGVGGKFGVQFDFSDKTSFAVAYQTKINMTSFNDYADLFANGGDFDIPADLKAGITFKPNPKLALSLDIEHIWFSTVDSVGNPISNIFACPTAGAGGTDLSSCLGGKKGAGFGWDDMTVYKIGARWNSSNDWTWRAGYSHGSQPIASSEVLFNILAPATIEDHATIGLSHPVTETGELSAGFMYAFNKKVTGRNTFDPTQTISLDMDQWEVEISYAWRLK